MKEMNRKTFVKALLGGVAGAAIATSLPFEVHAQEGEKPFQDIEDDKYYDLKGGQYGTTGGIGAPGKEWREDLISYLRYKSHCRMLDEFGEHVERQGYYFNVCLFFPHTNEEYHQYGQRKLPITREWLKEFCNRHGISED